MRILGILPQDRPAGRPKAWARPPLPCAAPEVSPVSAQCRSPGTFWPPPASASRICLPAGGDLPGLRRDALRLADPVHYGIRHGVDPGRVGRDMRNPSPSDTRSLPLTAPRAIADSEAWQLVGVEHPADIQSPLGLCPGRPSLRGTARSQRAPQSLCSVIAGSQSRPAGSSGLSSSRSPVEDRRRKICHRHDVPSLQPLRYSVGRAASWPQTLSPSPRSSCWTPFTSTTPPPRHVDVLNDGADPPGHPLGGSQQLSQGQRYLPCLLRSRLHRPRAISTSGTPSRSRLYSRTSPLSPISLAASSSRSTGRLPACLPP